MKKLPSVKTLSQVFGDKAKEARKILEMSRTELSKLPAGEARIRECHNAPSTPDIRMHCLSALAEGYHGLEAAENRDGEWLDYINAGDCYAVTLVRWRGSYRVCTVGDIAENPRNKF